MVQFICSNSGQGVKALVNELLASLIKYDKVLWLLSGGSNIPLSVRAMSLIPDELSAKLSITLTDERYGTLDHQDSNARQIREAGFDNKSARFIPILEGNLSLDDTVARFDRIAEQEFQENDIVIAQFGIGSDGHIAGILPESLATRSKALAAGYKAADFTRVTLTFNGLEQVDTAYTFAYGESKHTALLNLKTKQLELSVQPSQILKHIKRSFVYNDQVE